MTVAGAILPRPHRALARGEREEFLDVDASTRILLKCNWQDDRQAPVAILLHGLCGSAESPYMKGTASKLFDAGLSVVRMNLRNHGGTEELTPTLFHGGLVADLEAVLEWLDTRCPGVPTLLAGFSLGGNIVLKLAARWGAAPPARVLAIAAVSAAVDLAAASLALESQRANGIFSYAFLRELRRMVKRKSSQWPERFPRERLAGIRSIREFDEVFTAPLFGFDSALHYYAEASVIREARAIGTPSLLLHSSDDPFVPAEPLQDPGFQDNPRCQLVVTPQGGHVTFFGRRPARLGDQVDPDRFWAENRVRQYFLHILAGSGQPAASC